ncbi:hypothetical protein PBT90_13200 [Algoriphagus halophytocola]|uniref:hypothetical protein n=1 Tax=Algoriphagus halophytocola TaxID=2991499 RepID=UPI0022DE6294|nr:hypothetical protein [Algoriphagus sp. TR-M9]WBL41709.1 hypothetical protein PBT90_13200 [Algoriphagus sp. TR-M9]
MKTILLFVLFMIPNIIFSQVKDHAAYTMNNLSSYEKRKLRYSESREDGKYFLFQAGLRKHKTTPGENLYFDINGELDGVVSGLYGFRKGNLSFETGFGFIWHNSTINHFLGNTGEKLETYVNFNSGYLPVGFRYDIPLDDKKSVRFGAHASANIILFSTDKPDEFGSTSYSKTAGTENIYLDMQIEEKKFPAFFKVGLHSEIAIFKSSFLVIRGSYILSPTTYRTILYNWELNNESGSFRNETKIDGLIFEIAYKLPLNIFNLEK